MGRGPPVDSGDQLGRRPRRGEERLGRTERRGADVPDPAAELPRLQPYCPYTAGPTKRGKWTAPDLAKARALVARSGTRGMKVTVWAWSEARDFNRVAVKALHSLGYDVAVKPVVGDLYWGAVGDPRNRAQIGFAGLWPNYPDPASFLAEIFSC